MLLLQYYNTTLHPLMTFFPVQPWLAGTRKVKKFWILMKQEMIELQWHQLDHNGNHLHNAPCSRQITMPVPHDPCNKSKQYNK